MMTWQWAGPPEVGAGTVAGASGRRHQPWLLHGKRTAANGVHNILLT